MKLYRCQTRYHDGRLWIVCDAYIVAPDWDAAQARAEEVRSKWSTEAETVLLDFMPGEVVLPSTTDGRVLATILVPPDVPYWHLDMRGMTDIISNPHRGLVLELREASDSRSEGA